MTTTTTKKDFVVLMKLISYRPTSQQKNRWIWHFISMSKWLPATMNLSIADSFLFSPLFCAKVQRNDFLTLGFDFILKHYGINLTFSSENCQIDEHEQLITPASNKSAFEFQCGKKFEMEKCRFFCRRNKQT